MATPLRRPTDAPEPTGVESEGMDAYPTYRDGPVPPHTTTGTKPTDVGLPRSRRSYGLPMFIGLTVFALIILFLIVRGGIEVATSTNDAMTPGDTVTPAPTETIGSAPAAGGTQVPETDTAGEAQAATGAGEVTGEPGSIDVPGGAVTGPVQQPQ